MVPCYTFCSEKPLAPPSFWQGSPDVPVYQEGRKNGYTAQELAEIIFSVSEDKFLCRKQPLRIRSRKAFLIDLRFISLENLTADDNGHYKHQGTRTKVCTVDVDEECHIREFKITDKKRNERHSHNSYYLIERNRVCESCDALKTKTSYFEGNNNDYDNDDCCSFFKPRLAHPARALLFISASFFMSTVQLDIQLSDHP